jgi:hypothetical protein
MNPKHCGGKNNHFFISQINLEFCLDPKSKHNFSDTLCVTAVVETAMWKEVLEA